MSIACKGVKINDKHIEVIVRQMLQKIEVRSAGGTTLLVNEQVDREEFAAANAAAQKKAWKKQPDSRYCSHHQSIFANAVIYLGGIVPRNHPRPHRSGGIEQGRYA